MHGFEYSVHFATNVLLFSLTFFGFYTLSGIKGFSEWSESTLDLLQVYEDHLSET